MHTVARIPPPGGTPLTEREVDVVRCIAEGLTVPAAARRLGLAPRTVRKHLENVHRKLGTSGPVATVMRAVELGILEVPGSRS